MKGWVDLYERCRLVADRVVDSISVSSYETCGDACPYWLGPRLRLRGSPRGPIVATCWFDEARRLPQGGISLGRPSLRCDRKLGTLDTAEFTWLEKGSTSLGYFR